MRLPLHVSREDLAGAGVVALVQAARAYDPQTRVPFAQYARLRIRGAMIDELRATDWASRGARRRDRQVAEETDRLGAALGRPPTDHELANAMGIRVTDVARIREDARRGTVLSLQGATTHSDVMAETLVAGGPTPEERVLHAERIGSLLAAVHVLPERLRRVVVGYDLQERPMSELAAELGVTESRVSQVRAEALGLLREALAPDVPKQRRRSDGIAHRRREAYVSAARSASDLRGRLDAGVRALDAEPGPNG